MRRVAFSKFTAKLRRAARIAVLAGVVVGAVSCGVPSGSVTKLSDQWDFRIGFEPSWLTAPSGSEWKKISYPHNFTKDDDLRTGWITLRYAVPQEVIAAVGENTLAVNPGWLSDVAFLYWNETKLGQIGSADPYSSGNFQHTMFEVPAEAISARGPNFLTIVLYGNGDYQLHAATPVKIGPSLGVFFDHYFSETVSCALLSIYLVVGLYHLLLFQKRRQDKHNVFFGLFCIAICIYFFCRIPSRDWVFGNHVLIRYKVELVSLFVLGPFLLFFLSQFFDRRYSKIGLALGAYCGILAIAVLFVSARIADIILLAWQLFALPLMGYIMFYIVRAALRGNKDARLIALGISLLMLAGIHDIMNSMNILKNPDLARYVFVVFVLGIAGILANRFMRVHNEVEVLNTQLEEKVVDRTRQLQQTLTEVQDLKEQQDGDYFLTSLLLRPLGSVRVQSETVHVDFLVRQKKHFHFRKWESEIGGDLCIADSVTLRGKRFTVFVNADAMGKSIQGAGGAIVLGTVFKSMISRTQMSSLAQNRYPEQWLKECFAELQNVFVGFDGSMLVSAVIGLIEDDTGMFYYINAEHPWVVLFRKGSAAFLESDLLLRKIGVEGLGGSLSVRTFQLEPDDILIVGSDGRDDILVGTDAEGHRIINEDEKRFLFFVEEGQGDVYRIEQSILRNGQLTDDLSLMRIGYREDAPYRAPIEGNASEEVLAESKRLAKENDAAGAEDVLVRFLENNPGQPAVMRRLAQILIEKKDFERAAPLTEQYTELVPSDTDFLYYASHVFKRTGNLSKAADYGERCRLRQPTMVPNLVNLADVYRRMENFARAEMLIGRVMEASPGNSRAAALLARVQAGDAGDSPA